MTENPKIHRIALATLGLFLLAGLAPRPAAAEEKKATKKVIKVVTDGKQAEKHMFVQRDCGKDCEKEAKEAIVLQVTTDDEGKTKVIKKKILGGKSGFLGVYLVALTKELRKFYSGDDEAGVLVGGTVPKSPAEKAGVQVGDVIVAIDGKKVGSAMEIGAIVGKKKEGEKARVRVLRKGKPMVLTASVVEKKRHLKDLSWVSECKKKGQGKDCELILDPGKMAEMGEQIEVEVREALDDLDLKKLEKEQVLIFRDREKLERELEEKLKKVEERLRLLEKKLEGRARGPKKKEITT